MGIIRALRGQGGGHKRASDLVRATFAAFLALVPSAVASAGRSSTPSVNLYRHATTTFSGATKVAPAGDVNGDGVEDLLIGQGDIVIPPDEGVVHVIFGPVEDAEVSLSAGQHGGFRITGGSENAYASNAIGIGDVNDDGLDDVLVGAPQASGQDGESGAAYVVFGKTDTETVDLWRFDMGLQGAAGYRINPAVRDSTLGKRVAALGDLDGDGRGDFVVGDPFGGFTYVLYGKPTNEPVELSYLHRDPETPIVGEAPTPPRGYYIKVDSPQWWDDYSVANAGDVNGDGMTDVVIGLIRNRASRGQAYVVFGKRNLKPIDVNELGRRGFEVMGRSGSSSTGASVAGLGDTNGDMLSDIAIGAPAEHCCGPGSVYVIFGKRNSRKVSLRGLDGMGYRIHEWPREGHLGKAVSWVGDLNSDGLKDILAGAPFASPNGEASGSVYVIYGTRRSRGINVQRMTAARGFRMSGRYRDHAGTYLAGVGDVSGDRTPDLMVGGGSGASTSWFVSTRPAR